MRRITAVTEISKRKGRGKNGKKRIFFLFFVKINAKKYIYLFICIYNITYKG